MQSVKNLKIQALFLKVILILCFINCSCIFLYSAENNVKNPPSSANTQGLAYLNSIQEVFINIAKELKPAVVYINSVQNVEAPQQEFFFGDPFDFFGQGGRQAPQKRYYKAQSSGSGVIISKDGYILTNEHVVHSSVELKVTVNLAGEEKSYTGKVIGKDERTDIAILKIDAKNLPFVTLGDSDKIRVGEWVLTIGSPFGLEQTVTNGIISALRQSIQVEGKLYKDFIQTDAAINRGNSGGPLCNMKGEVIGINTAIYAPTGVFSGVGFAIPINRAKEIMNDLIHNGKVVRGWLGIEIKPIDDAIMKQFILKDKTGALVNNVMKNTPAALYGLKRGDVIKEFDGKEIKTPQELQNLISLSQPQKKYKLKIIREAKEQGLELVLGEMPSDEQLSKMEQSREPAAGESVSWLNMKLGNLTPELRDKYSIAPEENGVVVTSVEDGGKAQEIGLMEGDLIKAINRAEVNDLKKLGGVIKSVKLSDGVVFDVIREGIPLYLSYTSNE